MTRKKLRTRNILEHYRKLSAETTNSATDAQILEYEELDKLLMSARLLGNAKCRRLHMNAVHSSRQVKTSQLRLRLATLLIERLKVGSKVKLKTVTKLAEHTGRRWWLPLKELALRLQLTKARKEYYDLKKRSSTLRVTYLEDLAKQQAEKGNVLEVKRLHNLITVEKDRERSRRLKRLNPEKRRGGVTKLVVEEKKKVKHDGGDKAAQDQTTTREVTDKAELEDVALHEFNRRFRMSEPSPGMQPPLVNHLNYNGMTDYGDALLLGKAPELEGLDEYTTTYLSQLRAVDGHLPSPATPISFDEYTTEVNRLREGTSSGPSDVTPAMIKTELMDDELAEIGLHRFNFPWVTGYSNKRS